jgi:RNA polymerase sigma-70 factor (ECF subfamily)
LLKPERFVQSLKYGEGMDEEILQCVREGRRDEAIAKLLPVYRERVFALALSLLKDRGRAEDLAQEVFVKVWRALPGFDGRSQLSTWIYAITRNAALSALRVRRDAASLSDEAVLAAAEHSQVEGAGGGYDSADAAADGVQLEHWIAQLPERQQQVVRLYYLRECSVEETAAMLGVPQGTVKTLLFRAREQLRLLAGEDVR